MEGEAKFYGPAIDIKVKDALGRGWQGPTIQVDFNCRSAFDVNYVGEDGQPHRVVMVHRTVLGSMERFVAGLIEHYAGAFPVWLAPVQAMLIPIADRHNDYAREVAEQLKAEGFRVEVDDRSERMNSQDPRRADAKGALYAGRRRPRAAGRRAGRAHPRGQGSRRNAVRSDRRPVPGSGNRQSPVLIARLEPSPVLSC